MEHRISLVSCYDVVAAFAKNTNINQLGEGIFQSTGEPGARKVILCREILLTIWDHFLFLQIILQCFMLTAKSAKHNV